MWIPLVYRDVARGRYEISDSGQIRLVSGKILRGCNPKNEKGYIRVTLVTESGKLKKYALHRLILAGFTYDSDLEVDHLNCNKQDPALSNLEYVTGDENKHRASLKGRYKTCEDHSKSILTNEQVCKVCSLFEQGCNVRKVERMLHLENIHNIDSILTRILYRQSWRAISKDYKWDIDAVRLKVYEKEHLLTIAYLIKHSTYTSKEIASKFPQYNQKQLIQVIKKMRQGKLYKSIMLEAEGSTTIANNLRDGEGFIILAKKR